MAIRRLARSSSCWVQVSGSSEDFSRVQMKSDRCVLQAGSSDVQCSVPVCGLPASVPVCGLPAMEHVPQSSGTDTVRHGFWPSGSSKVLQVKL